MCSIDGARCRGFVSNLERHNVQVEAIVDRAAGILGAAQGARGEDDLTAFFGEQCRRAHTDRASAGQDHGALAATGTARMI